MKIIPHPLHAVLDYVYGATALAAPKVLGFEDDKNGRLVSTVVGVATIASGLTTRHEGGVIKMVPFNTHLKVDTLLAILTVASPWLLRFSDNARARNAMIALTLIAVTVVVLSQSDSE